MPGYMQNLTLVTNNNVNNSLGTTICIIGDTGIFFMKKIVAGIFSLNSENGSL
jgi:hypothetical protein